MPEVFLVCEGDARSIDNRILDALLVDVLERPITVEPGGGASSLASVAQYLHETRRSPAFSVADRDFRPSDAADAAFTSRGPGFLWRRQQIENYLLEPLVVLAAFDSFRASIRTRPGWPENLPQDVAAIEQLLRDVAREMAEDQAAWMTHKALIREKGDKFPVDLALPKVQARTGQLWAGRPEWLPALQREASRVANAAGDLSEWDELSPEAVEERYDGHLAVVSAEEFYAQGCHLTEFEGKKLFAGLHQRLGDQFGVVNLSVGMLQDEVIKVLPETYREHPNLFDPDAFRELADAMAPAP